MKRSGFTLIELAVVMAVIVTLTSLVVSGYLGIARAIASEAAPTQIQKVLTLARQLTYVDGRPVTFCILDTRSYVLVRPVGYVSNPSGKEFYDYYAPLAVADGIRNRLYNLDRLEQFGAKAYMTKIEAYELNATPTNTVQVGWKITWSDKDNPGFMLQNGNEYGVGLNAEQFLPKGWKFTTDSGFITFYPAKTRECIGGIGDDGNIEFEEELSKTRIKVRVESSGKIVRVP